MKRSLVLISVGLLNIVHALFHIIQFVQSIMLVVYSMDGHEKLSHNHSWYENLLHSPYFSILWAIVGVLTLVIGIKDYRHHKRGCEQKK